MNSWLQKIKIWKRPKQTNEKISLSELVWIGFNYTCGIAFPMSFFGVYYWGSGTGVGLHVLWIILLGAIMAGGTAWAFSKCSKVYNDTNGGAYVYVRGVFGRFCGWLIGFIQYIALPATIIVTIISMFRVNLDQLPIFAWAPQRWSSLIIDSIGVLIYGSVASCMYFGMKGFRWFVNISGIVKWASALFLIVCAIILVINNHGLAFKQAAQATADHPLTLYKFNKSFGDFFYFFLGFEVFIVVGKNVKNPAKNFSRGIIITLILATLFYLIVTVLVIGAITTTGKNGWGTADKNYNPNNVIAGIAGITGMVFLIISTLSLKLNGAIQNSLYSGGMIEPLAKEGYITEKLAKLNHENIAMRASTANLIITLFACVFMLIIPDAIGSEFDFSTILGFSTNITICVYIFVLLAAFIMGIKKQIKVNLFEYGFFAIVFLFLLIQFSFFNYDMVKSMITEKGNDLISVIIEFLMFWTFICIAVAWYFIYYQPKLKQRLATNPQLQAKLDQEFIPLSLEAAQQLLVNEPPEIVDKLKFIENEAKSITT